MYVYTHEKREVRLFFTLIKGFAIPHTVEKQPKSTPDMLNPPTHLTGGDWYYIPTRTFIVAVRTVRECCEDSDESQTTSINVFLCHVLLFYVCKRRYFYFVSISRIFACRSFLSGKQSLYSATIVGDNERLSAYSTTSLSLSLHRRIPILGFS